MQTSPSTDTYGLFSGMDISPQILEAVQKMDTETPPHRMKSTSSLRKHTPRRTPRYPGHLTTTANSSAEDVSTTSDSDRDHDYQTDFTTPATSDIYPEDMQPDDVEDFRDREYPQLKGKTYMDHGGTTLYAKSLVEEFSADLIANLYGNPHSASTPSAIAGHRIDAIRERTLRFFNADPADFDLIFTANATASIKLVIDCFKDHAATSNTPVWYGYHRDAHTSLVGVREATKMHRCFTSDEEVDVWINSGGLGGPRARQIGLFAYPGQSNMTGRRLPLSWPGRIRKSFHKAVTYTLLDAAALATTCPLDLSDPATAPDFVALSFYKIFGFPNIGALIVRKDSAHVLESRKYFGGGTVEMVISINDTWHAKKETSLHDRLEDGTLPFHSIFALDHAMNVHERLYGPNPMKFISHHTAQLGKQLYDSLSGLYHANGTPVCRIYKDEAAIYGDPTMQGATIAFNVQKSDGSLIGFEEVEEAADHRAIYVRSGSLCNPGGVATYLGWTPAEMKAAYASGHRCSNPTQIMLGKATGVVRVSLGAMSTAGDVQTLVRFLEDTYVETSVPRLARSSSLPMLNTSAGVIATYQSRQAASAIPPLSSESSTDLNARDRMWDSGDAPSLPAMSPMSPTVDGEKIRAFIPADYVKRRKPWEEEMRKQATTFNYGVPGDMKMREGEDGGSVTKASTPSFRARKFGRSVVNLLKSNRSNVNINFADQRLQQDPMPAPPSSSYAETTTSKRSVERNNFKQNLDSLGL